MHRLPRTRCLILRSRSARVASVSFIALAAILAAARVAPAAANQYLNPDLPTVNWNTTTAVWSAPNQDLPYNSAWQNDDGAVFTNSIAQNINVNGAVSVDNLYFVDTANVSIVGNSTITFASSNVIQIESGGIDVSISARLAGTTGLVFRAPSTASLPLSTLTLGGANTYTGVTDFRDGSSGPLIVKLGIATSGATGGFGVATNGLALDSSTATVDLNGFALGVGGLTGVGPLMNSSATTVALTVGNGDADGAYGGALSGNIRFVKTGSGTMELSGTNTYTGGTRLNGGTLQIGADNNLGAAAGGVTLNGGTLQLTGAITTARAFSLLANGSGGTIDTNSHGLTLTDAVTQSSDGSTLTKAGAGALTLGGSTDNTALAVQVTGGTLVLGKASGAAVHAIGGGLTIGDSATAQLGGSGGDQIDDQAGVTVNGGTFDLNARSETIGSLDGSTAGSVTNNAAAASTLTVNGGGTFNGAIGNGTGSVSLIKAGADSLTLGGTASNTGLGATVNAGTLVLGKTSSSTVHAIAAGGLAIKAGATVQLAGSGGDQIGDSAPVTLSGGTFDLNGHAETIGALNGTAAGVITSGALSAASMLTVSGGGTFAGTIANGAGGGVSLSKSGANTLTLSGANTYSGGTTVNAGVLTLNNTNTAVSPTGTGVVRIRNGATLTGVGAVGGNLMVADGGALAITTGTITAKGSVTLGDNMGTAATAAFDVGGGINSPTLTLATGASLALTHGKLTVNFSESLGAATQVTYLLVNNQGVGALTGTFESIAATLPAGDGYNLSYAYTGTALNGTGDGNELAITIFAVPEPSTWAMVFASVVGAAVLRRRVRRNV